MTRVSEWVLGIFGAIAAFMGLFIMFAGEEQYIGLAGEYTWQVGEIAAAWGYGLLIGGAVLLVGAAALMFWERSHPHVYEEQSERNGLITHIVVFVLVNGFLWLQDMAGGGGLEYAYWTTIPWGAVLVGHIIGYLSGGRHTASPTPVG